MNILTLILAILLSGLWIPVPGQPPQQRQTSGDCELRHPDLIDDLGAITKLDEAVFDDANWTFLLNFDEAKSKIDASWTNTPESAIAYTEILFYNCGYDDRQVEDYYDFEVIWANYDSWEETDSCEQGDLQLHEFAMVDDRRAYQVRYWIQKASKTRVMNIHLVFLNDDSDQLDAYSEALFPRLSSCEKD